MEVVGKLGLRYPPASSVDRESHAARIALLGEDCADIDPELLAQAASEWAKTEPFLPRACELRERAQRIGRLRNPGPVVLSLPRPSRPPAEPLTDDEIRNMPKWLIDLGIKVGDINPIRAAELRGSEEDAANG